jgi:DNA modification methylase
MIKLINRDCLDMTNIENVSLVYMDPPYSDKTEDKYYGVGDTFEEYLDYMKARLVSIKNVLHTNSNVLVHVDQKSSHYLKVICDTIFGRSNFQNEIVWCYASPSVAKSHLPRKHDTILWYGIGEYAFNQPHVPYVGKLKVGGKTSWNPDAKEEAYTDKGKKLEDWWTDIAALCRNESEKLGYSTQKPIKLMNRIVETFSNPGDIVMDPFCGSGSLLEAAFRLDRSAIGLDISTAAIELASKRLGNNDQA